jgi:YjbE family integral membrane protein
MKLISQFSTSARQSTHAQSKPPIDNGEVVLPELDIAQFLSALLAIVIIDIVLAGDNAIVIALAARTLPAHLQKRAIVWGAVGAIAVRSALTVVVVWLLKIPGLLLAGGLLLVWIAYRLLLPEDHQDEGHQVKGATTFWGAMRTIVIADAIMGLDNVLGVAGAAHGSYLLVVLGLLISVPIVIWGSTLVLRVVERFPALVYVGSGVLAFTAAKMISGEPILRDAFAEFEHATLLLYVLVPAVLWAGFVKNHRKLESRIHARLAEFAQQLPLRVSDTAPETLPPAKGEKAMLRVLVPVDGSRNALHAVRHVVNEYQRNHELELHLLNVQRPFSRHVARFVARQDRTSFHREQADRALLEARKLLDSVQVPYQTHVEVGERSGVICDLAQRLHCHHIVLGTARKSSLTRMLEDSVTGRVLERTSVPVEVVAGESVSKLERYGVPIGIGAGIGLLLLALD